MLLGEREPASDLYALGVTLHELLTRSAPGSRGAGSGAPFAEGEGDRFDARKLLGDPGGELPAELPTSFARLLATLRAPRPTERLGDAELAARALLAEARALGGVPIRLELPRAGDEVLRRRLETLPYAGDDVALEDAAAALADHFAAGVVGSFVVAGPPGAGRDRTTRELAGRIQRRLLTRAGAPVPTYFDSIPERIDADAALVRVRIGSESDAPNAIGRLAELAAVAGARGASLVGVVVDASAESEGAIPEGTGSEGAGCEEANPARAGADDLALELLGGLELRPLDAAAGARVVDDAARAAQRSVGAAARDEWPREAGGLAGALVRGLQRRWFGHVAPADDSGEAESLGASIVGRAPELLWRLAALGGAAPLAWVHDDVAPPPGMRAAMREGWLVVRGETLWLREDVRESLWEALRTDPERLALLDGGGAAPRPPDESLAAAWWDLVHGRLGVERLSAIALGALEEDSRAVLRLLEASLAAGGRADEPSASERADIEALRLGVRCHLGEYADVPVRGDTISTRTRLVRAELLRRRGEGAAARRALEEALRSARDPSPEERAVAALMRAWIAFGAGGHDEARETLGAMEVEAPTPLRAGLVLAAAELEAWIAGGHDQARAHLRSALGTAALRSREETPEVPIFLLPEARARGAASLGAMELAYGELGRGEVHLRGALEQAERLGAEHLRASVAANLGAAEVDAGRLLEGIARLRTAAGAFARLGRGGDLARVQVNLLGALRRAGEGARFERMLPEARALALEEGQGELAALLALLAAEQELGRAEGAPTGRTWIEDALAESASPRVAGRAVVLLASVDVAAAANRLARLEVSALAPVERALAEAHVRVHQVRLERSCGDDTIASIAGAAASLERARALASRWEDRFALARLGVVLAEGDETEGALAAALAEARALLEGVLASMPPAARRRFRAVPEHASILERAEESAGTGADPQGRWRRVAEWTQRLVALGVGGAAPAELHGRALEAAPELLVSERAYVVTRSASAALRLVALRALGRDEFARAETLRGADAHGADAHGVEAHGAEEGLDAALASSELAYSRGVAEAVLVGGRPFRTVEASSDARLASAASVHALALRSILGVPIPRVDRGEHRPEALVVEDRNRGAAFGDDAESVLRALARALGLALDASVRLREETAMRQQLAQSEERLRAIAETQRAELELLRARPSEVVAVSGPMRRTLALVDRVAGSELPIWLRGESGVGKSLLAREIHRRSLRADGPFVAESCAAIPEGLLESVLFGHVRGAFSGAIRDHVGLFAAASGGTLFLSAIEEMSPAMQAKILRVLQEAEVRPVGATAPQPVDTRLVVSSRSDLAAAVRAARFREDLYYRLAVVPVEIPPLRDRVEDLPLLVRRLLERIASEGRASPAQLSSAGLARLSAHDWPGNVRELENVLRAALVQASEPARLDEEALRAAMGPRGATAVRPAELGADVERSVDAEPPASLREAIDALEVRMVGQALRAHGGNRTRAAEALGLSRYGLSKMMKRLEIEPE